MLSTKQVVLALSRANPQAIVTEDRVRHVIRRGEVEPKRFATRLVWSDDDVATLAKALRLQCPSDTVPQVAQPSQASSRG